MSSISKQLSSISCTGRKDSSSSTEIRLVLLGKTGSGKSATANSILGRKAFESKVGSSSVTQRCRRACGDFRGRHITLLDTPGLLDTHQTPEEVQKELKRSVTLQYPGPHGFLLVFQIGRFTQEEKDTVHQIKQAMGSHVLGFSVVVFTHGDFLEDGTSVRHCLIEGCEGLAELVARCGGRYCVFNNHNAKTKEQVSELLAMVDSMVKANGGNCYTSKMLQKAEEEIAQDLQVERRLQKEKEGMVKRKQEAAVREWYQRELEMIQLKSKREIEELRQKQEMQRQKEEREAKEKEETSRREMEENEKREKERKIKEMVRVMEIRNEEQRKREALQEKLDEITKKQEEQTEREEKMRQAMEEEILKVKEENEKRQRERQQQQLQREQAIRRKEEMKREALEEELEKVTQSLEEQMRGEEERTKQREELYRKEMAENQREREREMENHRAEKKRSEALQQQLRLITIKREEQKASEEKLKRQLDESLRRERKRCQVEISQLKREFGKCSEMCEEGFLKRSAEEQGLVTAVIRPVSGYAQEMGLVALNITLESIGATCSIQ